MTRLLTTKAHRNSVAVCGRGANPLGLSIRETARVQPEYAHCRLQKETMSQIHDTVHWPAEARVAICAASIVALLSAAATAAAATCESLASVAIPFSNVTVAQSVPAGTFTPPMGAAVPNLPTFFRVA